MQVTIRNKPQELLVHTVSITINKNNPENVFLFFCPRCGFQISQIQGVVARIYPGLEPSGDIPVLHKCPQCGDRYTFQTKKFLPSYQTKLVLTNRENIVSTFHCIICRNPLLQYKQEFLFLLPSRTRVFYPVKFTCINPTCAKSYIVVDVI